jgi:hypothetical protein
VSHAIPLDRLRKAMAKHHRLFAGEGVATA